LLGSRLTPINQLDAAILDAVEVKRIFGFEMGSYHGEACGTTHCRAGSAIVLHPMGSALEAVFGSWFAGAVIYRVSTGRVPNFFATNEEALADMRACAAQEQAEFPAPQVSPVEALRETGEKVFRELMTQSVEETARQRDAALATVDALREELQKMSAFVCQPIVEPAPAPTHDASGNRIAYGDGECRPAPAPQASPVERPIVVGSTWWHTNDSEPRKVVDTDSDSVLTDECGYHVDKFRREHEWVSDPQPEPKLPCKWAHPLNTDVRCLRAGGHDGDCEFPEPAKARVEQGGDAVRDIRPMLEEIEAVWRQLTPNETVKAWYWLDAQTHGEVVAKLIRERDDLADQCADLRITARQALDQESGLRAKLTEAESHAAESAWRQRQCFQLAAAKPSRESLAGRNFVAGYRAALAALPDSGKLEHLEAIAACARRALASHQWEKLEDAKRHLDELVERRMPLPAPPVSDGNSESAQPKP
jgi:hypothetical protein